MTSTGRRFLVVVLLAAAVAPPARAQLTTLNANAIALRSTGAASGTDWVLSENGYVGSYITLAAPGNVTISVQAAGQNGGAADARMNLVVGGAKAAFDVAPGFTSYQHTFALPAGTHFVRTEYTNDFASNAVPATSRSMTVRNVTVDGAAVSNSNTDANALAAADTYIANSRRGPAHVNLIGATPGAPVHVDLKRHAFNWGGNVYGTSSTSPPPLSNPQFTQFFKNHFNAVVPSRAGKWGNNESTRDVVTGITSGYLDSILDFAEANKMRVRMHNLLWGLDDPANPGAQEQPSYVNNLLINGSAASLTDLRDEISERIDYYVGDGPGGLSDFSQRYVELDVYNESYHTGVDTPGQSANYWDRYGAAGVAAIYDEAAQAIAASGSTAKLFVNEYNVLQNGVDSYGNWYRQHIEAHQNADGDPADGPVGGVGMQLYPIAGLSPSYMQQVLQTMSVTGLPHSITEFGVQSSVTNAATAKTYVNQAMRMAFGDPDMNTFMFWGFWAGNTSSLQSASVLANADWSLTDIGKMVEDMLGVQDWDGLENSWTTDLTLPVAADGTIDFTGFYGDFEITVDGKTYALNLAEGQTDYQLVIDLAADFDNNGSVTSADLEVWRTASSLGGMQGDADGDQDSDGDDFLIWQRELGLTKSIPLATASTSDLPEPGALSLLAGASALAHGCVRRRGRMRRLRALRPGARTPRQAAS